MRVVSLFAGAGGLDRGFKNEGFDIVWANEYDKSIWQTFRENFPQTPLDTRSIAEIPSSEIPNHVDGIIGGPPCQSWSGAGSLRGIEDARGQLFLEYARVLRDKQPKFFLAENVPGMLFDRHKDAFDHILETFDEVGYRVTYKLLNTKYFGVPQDRKRVIFVGLHKSLGRSFNFPAENGIPPTLRDVIGGMLDPLPAVGKNKANDYDLLVQANHEYMTGGFSTIYMSRNRVRSWDESSFTIQAGGRHAPIHPNAPKMLRVETDVRRFVPGSEGLYRRLSVRECARIQTFPDDHVFRYENIADGYKMIGNAVPVNFAQALAKQIMKYLSDQQLGLYADHDEGSAQVLTELTAG